MIIKGRRPKMRHVSWTQQSCSWLVIRKNQCGLQDPNQICWHPKTNSQTSKLKGASHVMSGTIFFSCWISWISRCFLAAIFFQTENRVSSPGELRKVLRKRCRQWRNRDQWIWCQGTYWVRRKFEWSKQPGESRIGLEWCFIPRQETDSTHQPKPNNVFSREATTWHSSFQHQEIGANMNLQTQPAPGNWNWWGEPIRKNKSYISTTCRSPIICIWSKSSRTSAKGWISQKTHQ